MEQRRCFGCMELTEQAVCPRCGWGAEQNNEPHQLPVGTILAGKYQVGRVLGQGGFGITYLGWDLNLDIRVCIKEFFPASAVNRDHSRTSAVTCNTTHLEAGYASSRERFLREAKSMAKFRDVPQIVSIFDFFQANNTAYMVMQYIEGIDLAKYVRKRGGRIAMDETLRILKPVMEALSLVHKAGLIHRDIAPDNIMLHPRDGAKLMDFGAVRQVDNPDADGELTRSTEAILKNGFAPMEQYQSRGSLGPWTDVYALSATIYYCVTGRIPTEALTRMIEEMPLDWSGAEGITQRQIEVLEQGMAIRAKNRIQSVEELMAALYAPGKPEPQPAPKPLPKRGPELKHDPPRKLPRIPQSKTEPQGESLPDTTLETAPAATPQAMPETVPAAVSKATPEPAPAENAVKTELITDFKVTIPRPEPKQEPEPRPEPRQESVQQPAQQPKQVPKPRQEPVQQHAQEPKQEPEPGQASGSEPAPAPKQKLNKKTVAIAAALLVVLVAVLVFGHRGWYVKDGNYSSYLCAGVKLKNSWLQDEGNYYYLDENGTPVTGWRTVDGRSYYFLPSGTMATGWQRISGSGYYFFSDGTRATGWQRIDGHTYCFSPYGVMLTGTQTIDGLRYDFESTHGNLLRWEKELPQQELSSAWSDIHVSYTRNNGVLDAGGTALLMDKPVVDCASLTLHLSVTDRTSGNLDQWGLYLRDLNGNWTLACVFDLNMQTPTEGDTEITLQFSEPFSFDAYACLCHSLEWDWGFSFNPYFTRITVLTSEPMPMN